MVIFLLFCVVDVNIVKYICEIICIIYDLYIYCKCIFGSKVKVEMLFGFEVFIFCNFY